MNGAAVRPRWPAGVGVAVVLAALAFALALGGWTWRADRLVYDIGLSFWRRPVPEGIVIVAIDDASVAAIGRWPWPRAVHSTLLARLAAARPRAIGLDVTFSEPDADPAQDALLARQLAAAAPVVMSVDWVIAGPGQTPQLLAPVTGLPPGVSLGTAEASVDADGVMRHAFLGAGPAAAPLPHMALALLRAGGETPAPGLPVAVQDEQVPVAGRAPWLRQERFLVRYAGPPGHIERVSYLDVLRGAVPPERLAGRYVLVGMTATGLGDTVATPVNRQHHAMPGVEVLAHTLHTLRSGDTVRPLSPLEGATLSAALVLALLAGIERLGAGRGALVLAVGSVPLVVGISLAALGAGVWWSPVPWGLAAVLAYPLWSWRRLQQAVDALDAEIGLLGPEAGLSPGAPVPLPSRRRDALALRLDALHAATDTVRSARRFLSDALAGLPTAMAVTDERGRVLLANALAAQLFELDRAEDMPGLELPGLLVEFMPVPGAPVTELEAIFLPGPTAPAACVVEARAERLGDFLLHFAPVLLLGQQRWVVTFSDVSAIRQAQRRRDRALAFVSHDLRSPANALMLMADLYRRGRMDMTQQAFLDEVQRLGARTQQLADDFVRVAHVETRPLQCQPVALAALLDEVVADFRPQALAAQIRLNWQTDPTAGRSASVWPMDRALVQRAVGNLVSNAIKHSPAGGEVVIWVRTHADTDLHAEDALSLTVCDQGPGLSAEQRERLNQGDEGLPSGDAGGVGLGLQFVQIVARRHGGRLRALPGRAEATGRFELALGRVGAG